MENNVTWDVIGIINAFLNVLITYWFFETFLGKKQNVKRYINFIGFFLLFALSSILYLANADSKFILIFHIVSSMLYALTLFDGSFKAKSFFSALLICLIILSEFIAMFIITFSTNVSEQTVLKDEPYKLAGIIITNILILFNTKLLEMVKNHKNLYIPIQYWAVTLITPILSIVIMYSMFLCKTMISDYSLQLFSYIADVSLLIINYTIFYLFSKLIENFHIQTKYKLLEQQIEYQKSHYKDLAISNKEIRSLRHDIKNHLQCLNELIITNKNEEALKYIKSFGDIMTVNNRVINTGNSVLDSILNVKLMVINEKKIKFDYTIEIPNTINIDLVDICVLFGNSLDNAIEACDRVGDNDEKKITMVIAYRDNSLVYSITNTTNGKLNRRGKFFLSSKADYKEHGLGLANIDRTVKKYNGILEIEHENTNFHLSAVLYNI